MRCENRGEIVSMLSSMCDRLRQTADEVERIEGKNAVRLGLDAIALAYAVGELRDAADTIDGLRTRCQDAQAENEKLRANAAHWELEHCPSCKNVADLQEVLDKNAKLRELVRNMYGWLVVNYEKSYVIPLNGLNDIERDMRDLGIEVDE